MLQGPPLSELLGVDAMGDSHAGVFETALIIALLSSKGVDYRMGTARTQRSIRIDTYS